MKYSLKYKVLGALVLASAFITPAAQANSGTVPLPPVKSEVLSADASMRPVQLAQAVIIRTDDRRMGHGRMRHHEMERRHHYRRPHAYMPHRRHCSTIVKRMRTDHGWVTRRVRRCR